MTDHPEADRGPTTRVDQAVIRVGPVPDHKAAKAVTAAAVNALVVIMDVQAAETNDQADRQRYRGDKIR